MLRVRGDLWSTTCLKIPVETGRDNVHLDTARTVRNPICTGHAYTLSGSANNTILNEMWHVIMLQSLSRDWILCQVPKGFHPHGQ